MDYKKRTAKQWIYEWEIVAIQNPALKQAILDSDRKIQAILNATIESEGRDIVEREMQDAMSVIAVGSYIAGHSDGWTEAARETLDSLRQAKRVVDSMRQASYLIAGTGILIALWSVW